MFRPRMSKITAKSKSKRMLSKSLRTLNHRREVHGLPRQADLRLTSPIIR